MGFHHVALATKDLAATHAFYTEAMGFELVKVVAAPTPKGGWSKHVFYDTGGQGMIAFWELHDEAIGDAWSADLSRSVGLPVWVNHLAYDAPNLADLEVAKQRWREHGISVAEVDHGFCVSIYAVDPNGIMVEFCCTTREFSAEEVAAAQRMLLSDEPELEAAPEPRIYPPVRADALA